MGGYVGRVAYVDLSTGLVEYKDIGDDYRRRWLGGSGLGVRLLTDECVPTVDALSPENPLIFMTGPLTGTAVPGSGRHQVITKSPLTGIYGEADAGGKWGVTLKRAGLDGIVFCGAAAVPMYAFVHDGVVELLTADFLWGKDNFQTDEFLKDRHGESVVSASIGMAGERQVLLANIIYEGKKGRSSGRGGLGAVMGAKNLKAVAVQGHGEVAVHDAARLQSLIDAVSPMLEEKTQGLSQYGTAGGIIGAERIGALPIKNWSQGTWPEVENISGQVMAEKMVKGKSGCHGCPVNCGRTVKTAQGRFGAVDGKGPEYETLGIFGGSCMVSDLEAIAYANEVCNRYGLDTISAGASIAFLMDIYERGLIDEALLVDADGNAVRPLWGEPMAVMAILHSIGKKCGIGEILGQGVRSAAELIGGAARDCAFHVKGLELPAHDPRAFNSLALGYATSNRGACHLQGGSYFFEKSAVLPEVGITEIMDRFRTDNQGSVQARLQDVMSVMDSLKLCKFMFYGGINLTIITDWLNAVIGCDYTVDELMESGERIFNLKRLFNVACGISRSDDNLPPGIADVPRPDGGAAGNLPPLREMLVQYYASRGWDDDGKPLPSTLGRLGLE